MQGARSAKAETYLMDRRGFEHRATQQLNCAVGLTYFCQASRNVTVRLNTGLSTALSFLSVTK